MMATTFFALDTPVEIVATGMPSGDDYATWKELDLQSLAGIPANATGVIFHMEHTHASQGTTFGIRKHGSSDDRTKMVFQDTHWWGMIGVNGSGHIDVWIQYQNRDIFIYIVGYTIAGVTFKTNAVEISPSFGILDTWVNTDLSSIAPNAKGVIVEIIVSGFGFDRATGIRMHGSTDDRTHQVHNHTFAVMGVDDDQHIDLSKGGENTRFFLVGYITEGAVFFENAEVISLSSFGVWTDIEIAAGNVFAFTEATTGIKKEWGFRKNGSSEEIIRDVAQHYWAIVELDSSGIIEAYAESGEVRFYLNGHATLGEIYPSTPSSGQVRVTSLIHRFDRSKGKGIYSLEMSLGEVTAGGWGYGQVEEVPSGPTGGGPATFAETFLQLPEYVCPAGLVFNSYTLYWTHMAAFHPGVPVLPE